MKPHIERRRFRRYWGIKFTNEGYKEARLHEPTQFLLGQRYERYLKKRHMKTYRLTNWDCAYGAESIPALLKGLIGCAEREHTIQQYSAEEDMYDTIIDDAEGYFKIHRWREMTPELEP